MATKTRSKRVRETSNAAGGELVLASAISELNLADMLGDGFFKNVDGRDRPCARCNRRVALNGVYHSIDGHVYGPECVSYVNAVKDSVSPEDLPRVVKHQFILRMRALTIAGMKKKGLIKDKQPSTPAMNQELIDELIAMG
jgi:hypothetical protein